jgi:hypothetical protein
MLGALGAGLLAVAATASAAPAQAATFTVVNTANNGPGSLRSMINAANMTAAADEIVFAIPGAGPHVISLNNDLPFVTNPVTIDGYSQPGAAAATAAAPANPKVVIDATNAARGLHLTGNDIEVRGLVINNAQVDGIWATGARSVIAGNYVGVTASGTATAPNAQYGVHIDGNDHVVGGPGPESRNVISGNGFGGVRVHSGTGNRIEGSYFGTGELGLGGLGGGTGVLVDADQTTVKDNLISFSLVGVQVEGDDNTLQGNKVGTNVNGTAALGNLFGVLVSGGDANLIGGTGDDEGNLVSGNSFDGLLLSANGADPAEDNEVQGNLFGTDVNGTAALANDYGVRIFASSNNTISDGNVISGNQFDGVKIESESADNDVVENFIGTDPAGLALGNGESGVEIADGDQNEVGDAQAQGNTIAHNGIDGVTVSAGQGNAIRRNSIHDNGLLGIDLAADGPTANDFLDQDSGPNQLQNGPVVNAATPNDVTWALDSVPGTSYRLEFYASSSCGQAETYLDTLDVTTDANGHADGVEPVAPGSGVYVTMTATKLSGVAVRQTSEISPCRLVP